jgi:hypothetical protein
MGVLVGEELDADYCLDVMFEVIRRRNEQAKHGADSKAWDE